MYPLSVQVYMSPNSTCDNYPEETFICAEKPWVLPVAKALSRRPLSMGRGRGQNTRAIWHCLINYWITVI